MKTIEQRFDEAVELNFPDIPVGHDNIFQVNPNRMGAERFKEPFIEMYRALYEIHMVDKVKTDPRVIRGYFISDAKKTAKETLSKVDKFLGSKE